METNTTPTLNDTLTMDVVRTALYERCGFNRVPLKLGRAAIYHWLAFPSVPQFTCDVFAFAVRSGSSSAKVSVEGMSALDLVATAAVEAAEIMWGESLQIYEGGKCAL
jgi:hypothetical protein